MTTNILRFPSARKQTWLSLKNAVPVCLNTLGENDENKTIVLPGWPILPNHSENYLRCSLAEQEDEEFD